MCDHGTHGNEDGLDICFECGLVLGPLFVPRFRHGAQPLYIYSRVERFIKKAQQYINDTEDIRKMSVFFERIERAWTVNKDNWPRKYFLNMKLVVLEIARKFGINLEETHGPGIKDAGRVKKQKKQYYELVEIIEHNDQDQPHLLQPKKIPPLETVEPVGWSILLAQPHNLTPQVK